jgi:hypothetical protein
LPRKKKVESEASLIPGAEIEPTPDVPQATIPTPGEESQSDRPDMESPEWTDYVLGLLKPEEVMGDGHPKIDGLRRVTPIVLGPILQSIGDVTNCLADGTVIARHYVKVYSTKYGCDLEVQEVGSVNEDNCPDVNIRRFAAETASTRAESRALRKLLKLRRLAAEEVVPTVEENNGFITNTQLNFIETLCARNGIDSWKYMNSGKHKYTAASDIPYATAKGMIQFLSECQRDQSKIKDEWKLSSSGDDR